MKPLQSRRFGHQCPSWRLRNHAAAAAVADSFADFDSAPAKVKTAPLSAQHPITGIFLSAQSPAPLACFLASHVSDAERAAALNRVLQSISVASDGGPAFLAVSWSSDGDSAIQSAVHKSLSDAAARGLTVRAYEQPTKTSQFEHYRKLAESCASAPPEWVMFSDDDDVWSERRHAIYAREAASAAPTVTTLLCRRKTAMLAAATQDDEPRDAAGVRRLLSRRLARFTDCNLKDGLDESEHNMPEYFDMAVRYPVLATFFARVPPCVTQHRLCDLSFCFLFNKESSYSKEASSTRRFMPTAEHDDDFVYFYSRGARAGGASGVKVQEGESEFALAQLRAAPQPVQRWFVHVEET